MFRNWLKESGTTLGHFRRLRRQTASFAVLDERWLHHGAHSGYLVGDESYAMVPRDCRLLPVPLKRRIESRIGDVFWERRNIAHMMLRVARIKALHLVSGDFDTWFYSKRPAWLKTKITATFHQPVDRLEEIAAQLRPGMLDGIVCVSRDQLPVMRHLAPEGRCVFIPHGVDTEFFREASGRETEKRPLLLSVGVHRRDFETLVEAARIIKRQMPHARVLLVGPREKVETVKGTGIVETLSDVSDTALRELYQRSTMLFMPLEAATANNALLEAMACGRPAVVSDVPALYDYTSRDAAVFCARGDAQAHAEAAIALLRDESMCRRMGLAARSHAVRVGWPRVRQMLSVFMTAVAMDSVPTSLQ